MNFRSPRCTWRATAAASTLVGFLTFVSLIGLGVATAPRAAAADSSVVTLTAAAQDPDAANAPFPNLSVTVSQTTNLVNQGIRLTYSGGSRSAQPNNQTAGSDFLQVVQCWGDLEDANGNPVLDAQGQPQPDRTTCQYGSGQAMGMPGQSRTSTKASLADVSAEDETYLYKGNGVFDPPQVSIPFRSVTGKTLQSIVGGKVVATGDIDNNEFFTQNTTNELDWAGFGAAGSGTATFEVQTNMQAPGLGCGNPQTAADGTVTGQPCWLVVIPRGTHDLGEPSVRKSALLWENWKHRLAVRLDFKALGVRCALGAAEKALGGTELMTTAVASWQPKLCGASGGSIYNLIVTDEADQLATANGTSTTALALTTRALSNGSTDNLTYAPVAVTGLAVAFAVDHVSNPLDPAAVPDDVKGLDQQPITQLNLTPRLVAKLLTDSYVTALPVYADVSYLKKNPQNITTDPDFLAVNDPMWKYQNLTSPALADALVPLGRSDSAVAVWNYVLSDPDAVAFLAGKPDPWGMVVNPYSSTDAAQNPNGVAATYPTDSFPKADPVEVDSQKDPSGLSNVNLVTWRPYATDLDTAGYWVLRGDGRLLGQWNNQSTPPKYAAASRDLAGSQKVIGLTDTAAAAKYQIFTAALRNPAGKFVTPTSASMAAAAAVMTPTSGQSQVRALDFASPAVKSASDAYPLTVPVYAATNPAGGDAATRSAYAAFIRYAAGSGQTPGTDDGQLPAGYAPLPADWRTAAAAAAATILAGPSAAATSSADTSGLSTSDATQTPIDVSRAADAPVSSEVPAADATPATTNSPTASGAAAGPLVGATTPGDPSVGPLRAVIPGSALGGLLAAACVPLISRIRRGP
jgi:hypothetical protein